MKIRPVLSAVLPVAFLTVLSACAVEPFDASAPWRPDQPAEGRSYTGGMLAQPPAPAFGPFERERPEALAPVELPRAGGENPWATPPRNPIVTVCHSRLLDSAEAVEASARDMCPADSTLVQIGADIFWNTCPLLRPRRSTFQCLTGDVEPPPELTDGRNQ
jgi:hypothetical protein